MANEREKSGSWLDWPYVSVYLVIAAVAATTLSGGALWLVSIPLAVLRRITD